MPANEFTNRPLAAGRRAQLLPFHAAKMSPSGIAAATFRTPLRAAGRAVAGTRARRERARRVLNVAVALLGLIVAAPVLLLLAAAIKLTSRGPIIYSHTRIGVDRRRHYGGNHRRRVDHGGKPFTIFKLRTMVVERSADPEQRWASPSDPRVTPLGRVLRKLRLDELPQLVNVIRGDMNIVGPRPEQPRIFASLSQQIPSYRERQRVLPGITGWAQVNQHYDACLDDVRRKVSFDLEYVARRSVGEDLKIMLRTVPAVAFRRGGW
jgi:lipopolysaccharide/colanic/teichoic acid biosynthesis glycosyltransferase